MSQRIVKFNPTLAAKKPHTAVGRFIRVVVTIEIAIAEVFEWNALAIIACVLPGFTAP